MSVAISSPWPVTAPRFAPLSKPASSHGATTVRFMKWAVGTLLLAAICLTAGILVPRPISATTAGEERNHLIKIFANPIHTDIAIPVNASIIARFSFLADANIPINHPNTRWLVIGWGGKSFYTETPTWADLKPLPILKSLTLDRSVLHVEVTGENTNTASPLRSYRLSDAEFERLLQFIEKSFRYDKGRPVFLAGASYGPHDGFFEGVGMFNVLAGCNTWTAQALRVAGVRTGWWTPLPATLLWSLDLHNPEPPSAG